MENPNSWGPVEHAIKDAILEHRSATFVMGTSLPMAIATALRQGGFLGAPASAAPTPVTELCIEDGDETVTVLVNGEAIAHANHDEHGWAGMALLIDTTEALAKALALKVSNI